MAKIIVEDIEYNLEDRTPIAEVCDQAGVPFNCNSGMCGSCQIEILEGAENLDELTDEEQNLGLDCNNRLACQCSIKCGTVRIKF